MEATRARTALMAFRENFDRWIALGMALIAAGAVVLSWPGEASFAGMWPALAVLGACFAWGVDNNLTRKVSQLGKDAIEAHMHHDGMMMPS